MSEAISAIEQALKKQQAKEGDTTVIIAKDRFRAIPQTMFVFLFIENLYKILAKYKLSQFDLKLMLLMLTKMQYGNHLQITQKALSIELETSVQQVSRGFKSLKDSGILVVDEFGSLFFNLELVLKGKFTNIPEHYEKQYKASIARNHALENKTTPPFDFDLISQQITKSKKKKPEKATKIQQNAELNFNEKEEF